MFTIHAAYGANLRTLPVGRILRFGIGMIAGMILCLALALS